MPRKDTSYFRFDLRRFGVRGKGATGWGKHRPRYGWRKQKQARFKDRPSILATLGGRSDYPYEKWVKKRGKK